MCGALQVQTGSIRVSLPLCFHHLPESLFAKYIALHICMAAFHYSPLHHARGIRLLVLHPGAEDSSILCHLEPATFGSELGPRYEALSYTWGDPDSTLPIYINGNVLRVRKNLWWALQSLRYQDEKRVLWINAICINQHDTKERNH